MRVLCVCVPGVGHVAMMVPIARALVAAGHEVAFATGPDFVGQVERTGFAGFPAGPDRAEARRRRRERHPESIGVSAREQQLFHVSRVWAGIYAPAMLPDLHALVRSWRPDVIVHDVACFAAPLVAAVHGLPAVSHSFGPGFGHDVIAAAEPVVAALWAQADRPPPVAAGSFGALHLDVWPRDLQRPDTVVPPSRSEIRTGEHAVVGAGDRPRWWADLGTRPVVHFTLGTVFNDNPRLLRVVVAGLAGEPVDVVVTVGPSGDPGVLYGVPGRVHVARWIPHGLLMPRCALVIGHAGAGTTLAALRHAVPSIYLPLGADGFRVAEAGAAAGVGLVLDAEAVEPSTVRSAVREVLDGGIRTDRLQHWQAVVAAMPEAASLVPALVG